MGGLEIGPVRLAEKHAGFLMKPLMLTPFDLTVICCGRLVINIPRLVFPGGSKVTVMGDTSKAFPCE